ncbi:hypothetical protein DICA0_B05732 [Diutina catenulata]
MLHRIRSAGCLIIGDEVLNGKIHDTNSFEFAKICFNQLSVPVKRVVVCSDDKTDIQRSLQQLQDDGIDFIVTSGGLGSTHDDVTYDAIAEHYGVPCVRNQEVVDRMNRLRPEYVRSLAPAQLDAYYRMATLPTATASVPIDNVFVDPKLWFPIVEINYRVYILPGVPQLFVKLMQALVPRLLPRIDQQNKYVRRYVKTTTGESELAPFLGELQREVDAEYGAGAIKIGSYPHMAWRINTLSIIGAAPGVAVADVQKVVDKIVATVGGDATQIDQAEEDRMTNTDPKM